MSSLKIGPPKEKGKTRTLKNEGCGTHREEPPGPTRRAEIRDYYDALFLAHGPQQWWPGRTRFEVIVGAILTQNTSWTNVEKAIRKLRREKLLSIRAMEKEDEGRLAELVRSSGYYRQKAKKLKAFVQFVGERYEGSLNRMFGRPTDELRQELLEIHGIGPETADSILLYAGGHAVFVVDAYTRRILERHGLVGGGETYEEIRELFEAVASDEWRVASKKEHVKIRVKMFNEYHALIVKTGKEFCRKKEARCERCALREFVPVGGLAASVRPRKRRQAAALQKVEGEA